MTLFLDSAKIDEIVEILEAGCVHGVTTNPKLLSSAEFVNIDEYISELACLTRGMHLSVELLDPYKSLSDLRAEAVKYSEFGKSIVIKVPMMGLKTCKLVNILHSIDIPVNVTCLMSNRQAIVAAQLEPEYISIFYNRVIDWYKEHSIIGARTYADQELSKIRYYLDRTNFSDVTELIAGSIRHVDDVEDCLNAGADIVTVPYKILLEMFPHEKTEAAVKEFTDSWKSVR